MRQSGNTSIDQVRASVFRVPTDRPESDGTLEWDSTTMVVVEVSGGDETGLGYAYAERAAARLIVDKLGAVVQGRSAMDVPAAWRAMVDAVRNGGRPGIASMAIGAIDIALWDLKAKLLGVPLVSLLGAARTEVEVYGSGGFTSYTPEQLTEQLEGWAEAGLGRVKMKVGRDPSADSGRVRLAREAIGPDTELFVDANGAYSRKQALAFAEEFAKSGVSWFEEPVSSDDLEGLRLVRDRGPAGMAVAAGEYGYDSVYFRRMLEAGAVDILQADATRCTGISGFLLAGALCDAYGVPFSAHTAPSAHVHVACAVTRLCHLEYFHDHVRIERMFFDGFLTPHRGALRPDLSRAGLGLALRRKDMEAYEI